MDTTNRNLPFLVVEGALIGFLCALAFLAGGLHSSMGGTEVALEACSHWYRFWPLGGLGAGVGLACALGLHVLDPRGPLEWVLVGLAPVLGYICYGSGHMLGASSAFVPLILLAVVASVVTVALTSNVVSTIQRQLAANRLRPAWGSRGAAAPAREVSARMHEPAAPTRVDEFFLPLEVVGVLCGVLMSIAFLAGGLRGWTHLALDVPGALLSSVLSLPFHAFGGFMGLTLAHLLGRIGPRGRVARLLLGCALPMAVLCFVLGMVCEPLSGVGLSLILYVVSVCIGLLVLGRRTRAIAT